MVYKRLLDFEREVEREHKELRRDKDFARSLGYKHHVSIYGYVADKDGNERGCRAEVFFKKIPTREIIEELRNFFETVKPKTLISVFIYDERRRRFTPVRPMRIMRQMEDDILGGLMLGLWG